MTENLTTTYDHEPLELSRQLVPEIGEEDANRLGTLIQYAKYEQAGEDQGLSWALDYAVTHSHALGLVLDRTKHDFADPERKIVVDVALADRPPYERLAPRTVLMLAQDIQTSNMAWRLTIRPGVPGAARVAPEAVAALDSDTDYRYSRSRLYADPTDTTAFRMHQNQLLLSLARYAANGGSHTDTGKEPGGENPEES